MKHKKYMMVFDGLKVLLVLLEWFVLFTHGFITYEYCSLHKRMPINVTPAHIINIVHTDIHFMLLRNMPSNCNGQWKNILF